MNIITIGDLHGSESWKQIHPQSWDRIVFAGDYADSFYHSDEQILLNFQQVLLLKKNNPEKVILLLGNHDLHYYFKGTDRHYCTGFRRRMLPALHKIFQTEKENFQAAFQVGNHLWTHAGVVQRWYNHFIKSQILSEDENVASTLNRLFLSYYLPLFHVSELRGGLDEYGGIFWAHSTETQNDPLPEYHQIVGHTKTNKGVLIANFQKADTSFTYVDCLETRDEFYELNL